MQRGSGTVAVGKHCCIVSRKSAIPCPGVSPLHQWQNIFSEWVPLNCVPLNFSEWVPLNTRTLNCCKKFKKILHIRTCKVFM